MTAPPNAWSGFATVPNTLRCFNCYGHAASHSGGRVRCSICGGENKYSECSAAVPKCPNSGGHRSANKKSVPDTNAKLKFLNEKWKSNRPVLTLDKRIELLEIQMLLHSPLFSLAQHRRWIDRSYHARPSVIAAPLPHPTGVPLEQDELTVTEQVDFSSLFGSPLTFLAFLAEVMKETILAKDKRDN